MDRTAWIVVISCGLGIVLWYTMVLPKMVPEPPPPAPDREAATEETGPPREFEPEPAPAPVTLETAAELRTEVAAFEFTTTGGGVAEAKILDHAESLDSEERIVLNDGRRRKPRDRRHEPEDPRSVQNRHRSTTPPGSSPADGSG